MLIDPTRFDLIEQLHQDDIAFPAIDYAQNVPINLTSTTLHAAYSIISTRVDPVLHEDY